MSKIVNPLALKVEEAIMNHDAFLESYEINVLADGGVVTMRGKVPSKKYLQLAEKIAQGIEGVSSVINQMDIDSSLEEQSDLLDLNDESKVPPARSGPHARGG